MQIFIQPQQTFEYIFGSLPYFKLLLHFFDSYL